MLNMPKRGALLEAVIARLQASLGCLFSDVGPQFWPQRNHNNHYIKDVGLNMLKPWSVQGD